MKRYNVFVSIFLMATLLFLFNNAHAACPDPDRRVACIPDGATYEEALEIDDHFTGGLYYYNHSVYNLTFISDVRLGFCLCHYFLIFDNIVVT